MTLTHQMSSLSLEMSELLKVCADLGGFGQTEFMTALPNAD
jgi:hypothetical protein